jgi:hypothetical protein
MKLTNLSEAPGGTEAPRRGFRRFAAVRSGSQLVPGFGVGVHAGASMNETDPARINLSRGTGPVGTGRFLLRATRHGEDRWRGHVWLTLMFLPVFPLRPIELRGGAGASEALVGPCTVLSQGRLTARQIARGYAWGLAALLGVAASWSVAYLNAANTSLPGGLGVLFGGVAPVALVACLDGRTPRISTNTRATA